MRGRVAIFAFFAFVGCSATRVARTEPATARPDPALSSELDSSREFLLASAAADFHAHGAPARVRQVRMGHVVAADGARRYMLCGEFLATQSQGDAPWTPFATLKTSGYEQWLGAPAASYCGPRIIWDDRDDLSPALQSRLDSLR